MRKIEHSMSVQENALLEYTIGSDKTVKFLL